MVGSWVLGAAFWIRFYFLFFFSACHLWAGILNEWTKGTDKPQTHQTTPVIHSSHQILTNSPERAYETNGKPGPHTNYYKSHKLGAAMKTFSIVDRIASSALAMFHNNKTVCNYYTFWFTAKAQFSVHLKQHSRNSPKNHTTHTISRPFNRPFEKSMDWN